VRVLTVAESRALDAHAIEALGIPPLVLMENAALGVADALAARFAAAERVAIVCGPGNNGADGLAVGRQLAARGYAVDLFLARFGRALSSDCAAQLAIAERLGLAPRELAPGDLDALPSGLARSEVVIDALFGSGLTRPLAGEWARLVEALGAAARPVVAIDLPSGLDGDRAAPIGPAVRADLTVTFVAPKPAQLLDPACDLCGELVVADLGFPVEEGGGAGALHLLVPEELAAALSPRPAGAHKGSFGHLLLVAGSVGKAGAAVLAARAAVAAGAGLTTVALPAPLHAALADACPEAMTLPLPARDGALALAALEPLLAAAAGQSAVALGPGIGRAPETEELVRRLALALERPLLLDADGLNAFEGRIDELATRPAPTVLTPHPGELARLLGTDTAAIQSDRLAAARAAARRAGAVVALKGRGTIVAAPDGEAWINATGNPGMASGGSGDVLTGIAGARLAQGDEASFAAALSVHLHGAAGDLARARLGGPAVPASELIASFGAAYARLAG
jgi:NAD(P)H-hydrate epimerase